MLEEVEGTVEKIVWEKQIELFSGSGADIQLLMPFYEVKS
jgi:hypothetical protein